MSREHLSPEAPAEAHVVLAAAGREGRHLAPPGLVAEGEGVLDEDARRAPRLRPSPSRSSPRIYFSRAVCLRRVLDLQFLFFCLAQIFPL